MDATVISLLESSLAEVHSQGAYLYRFGADGQPHLAASAGLPPGTSAGRPTAEVAPVVIREGAWRDARFARLPEFTAHRFEGVISIPVSHNGRLVARVNFCRAEAASIKPSELQTLLVLGQALGALVARAAVDEELRTKVDQLAQELADRKLLDRAKGLLQARFEWTEEEAYLYVRRLSRQRRVPKRVVATEIIQSSPARPFERAVYHAV